jgi:hypothetical protein
LDGGGQTRGGFEIASVALTFIFELAARPTIRKNEPRGGAPCFTEI